MLTKTSQVARIVLFFLLLSLLPLSCSATSMAVARTQNGFVIGTNTINSGGTSICKLHVSRNAVVLRAGEGVLMVNGQTKKVAVSLDADLNHALQGQRTDSTIEQLQDLVITSTMKSLRNQLDLDSKDRTTILRKFIQAFIIAAKTPQGFQISAFELRAMNQTYPEPIVTQRVSSLDRGELLDWSGRLMPTIVQIPSNKNAITAVRRDLEAVHRLADATKVTGSEHSNKVAFDPPFSLVTLTENGIKAVAPMPVVCKDMLIR